MLSLPACSGQRWVGGAPDMGAGWQGGYEPVAMKIVRDTPAGRRERSNLQRVQQAFAQQAGPHHITSLLDAFTQPPTPSAAGVNILVTR